MPHSSSPSDNSDDQLDLNFDDILEQAEILSREQVNAKIPSDDQASTYNPVARTAEYMAQSMLYEHGWEGTIKNARQELQKVDARQIYLDFLSISKIRLILVLLNQHDCVSFFVLLAFVVWECRANIYKFKSLLKAVIATVC